MDTNTEDKQIQKEVIRLFCLIIRKDPKAFDEVSTALTRYPSIETRRLEFTCGSSYNYADTGCACQVDHELFTYVSHDGLDTELFDHILASIEDGKCRHHNDIPKEDIKIIGPIPTSVQLIHAAAAVGCVPVLEIFLTQPEARKRYEVAINLLNATPLHLAILFKQRQCIKTIIESGHDKFETYCNNQFIYAVRSQTNLNLINKTSMSIIKLCMVMNDNQTAQNIVQHTSLRAAWVIDAMTGDSEYLKALILPRVNEHLIGQMSVIEAENILKLAIKTGHNLHLASMLINKLEDPKLKPQKYTFGHKPWTLLATIYNQPRILEAILDSNMTSGTYTVRDYTIFDIANSISHSECADILQSHGIKGSINRTSSPFLVILDIIWSLRVPEQANVLLQKIWLKKPVAERKEECKALVVDPVTYTHGIGLRALIEICGDVEVKGPDGFTPLALALKHSSSPRAILDVLYCNPILTDFEKENMVLTHREKHLQSFDREKVTQKTSLALAIERDLKKWALDGSGCKTYQGSMATLLLECGYDIRGDKIVRSSYTQLLQGGYRSAREREIRQKILHKIESELYRPKSLKEYCRNSLRGAFPGLKLHMLMNTNLVPTTIKNFILLESRLKQRYDERSAIVCIEETL